MALTRMQRWSISGKHREDWYRALGKTANDALPMFEVLSRMEAEFAKIRHPLAPLVKDLLWRLKGGGSASRANAGRRTLGTELRGLVPDAEAMLIQAGVLSGNMSAGLFNAADLVATQGRLKGAVIGAMLKPVGYLGALVVLLIFFSVSLLPKFERGRAVGAGQFFAADGRLNQVTVVDTRDADTGWNVVGQVSNFSAGPGKSFSGSQLGWTPVNTEDTAAFTDSGSPRVASSTSAVAESPSMSTSITSPA